MFVGEEFQVSNIINKDFFLPVDLLQNLFFIYFTYLWISRNVEKSFLLFVAKIIIIIGGFGKIVICLLQLKIVDASLV